MTTKVEKTGKPRKSRQKRVPHSFGSWQTTHFEPRDEDWGSIEGALGSPLDSKARRELVVLVNRYFDWEPFEINAPFVNDAREYLEKIERAGTEFWQSMFKQFRSEKASAYVQVKIDQHLNEVGHRLSLDWARMLDVMTAWKSACRRMRDQLKQEQEGGVKEGAAWNELVIKLRDFAKRKGLKPGVSVRSDGSDTASPVVEFIWSLQATFPRNLQRHHASKTALSQAIKVAHRERSQRRQ